MNFSKMFSLYANHVLFLCKSAMTRKRTAMTPRTAAVMRKSRPGNQDWEVFHTWRKTARGREKKRCDIKTGRGKEKNHCIVT